MLWDKMCRLFWLFFSAIYYYTLIAFTKSQTNNFENSFMSCNGSLTNNGGNLLAANYCLILPRKQITKSWYDSQVWCNVNYNSSLAIITSTKQDEFMRSFLSNMSNSSDIWIGGKTYFNTSVNSYNWYWWSYSSTNNR